MLLHLPDSAADFTFFSSWMRGQKLSPILASARRAPGRRGSRLWGRAGPESFRKRVTRYDAPTNHVSAAGQDGDQRRGRTTRRSTPSSAWNATGSPQSVSRQKTSVAGPPPNLHRAAGATPPDRVKALDPSIFFKLFAQAMKASPPHAADQAMVRELAQIGSGSRPGFRPALELGGRASYQANP